MSKNKIRGTNLTPACDIWSFGAVLYTSIVLIPPTFALEFQHRKQYNLNKIYSVDEWIVSHNQIAQFGAFLEFEDMRFENFTIPGVKTSQSLRSMIKNMLHDNSAQRPTVDNILQDEYLKRISEKLRESKRAEPYEYLKYSKDLESNLKITEGALQLVKNEKKNLCQVVRDLVTQRDDVKLQLSDAESKYKTLDQSLRDQQANSKSEIEKLSGELVKKEEEKNILKSQMMDQTSILKNELEETRRLLRELQGI